MNRFVDSNWCPDCGLPRGVCDCEYRRKYEIDNDDMDDDCAHDFLDSEGFCIDCGVHVSDRLSMPQDQEND